MSLKKGIFFLFFAGIFLLSGAPHSFAATWYTNSSTGNDTTGTGASGSPYKTFHKAYTSASSGDTINLTGTFTWTDSGETGDSATTGYTLTKNLTLQGQGASSTIIQATSTDNTADRRVFTVPFGSTAVFNDLTIRFGRVSTSQYGGNIDVVGSATIDSCDISYGRATDGGGGGVNVWGSATVQNSVIHHNVASYMGGGLNRHYYTSGNGTPSGTDTLDVINSTVAYNTVTQTVAYLEGGGIFYRRGLGAITNSTITLNQVTGGASASTHGVGTGDGAGRIQLKNNIIAGNVIGASGGDLGHRENGYGRYDDNGNNIIGRLGFYSGGYASSSTSWFDAIRYNLSVDGTYALQDGSGTTGSLSLDSGMAVNNSSNDTMTFAISSASSVAVDHGATGSNGATTSVPSLDQRGASRSGTTDIGAYEYNGGGLTDSVVPTVSLTAPSSAATVSGAAVSLTASASDNNSVAGVSFYVDGALQGSEDTTSTYGVTWNSTATSSGSHFAFAVARDSSNNYATSSSITFTVDNTGPVISSLATSTATNTASITWTTDEQASSQIIFGVLSTYGTSTTERDTSSRVTSHTVTMAGLPACTYFYFRAQGSDAQGNLGTSSPSWFRTTGCTGGASISGSTDGTIATSTGGTLTQGNLTLTIPTSFTTASSSAIFQAHQLEGSTFFASAGAPSNKIRAGSTVFRLTALTDATTTITSFAQPLTVTLSYDNDDIDGVDESTLKIYRYDSATWSALSNCTVDSAAQTVSCTTTAFSDFAIFGDESTSSGDSSSSSAGGGVIVGFLGTNKTLPIVGTTYATSSAATTSPTLSPATTTQEIISLPQKTNYTFTRTLRARMQGEDVKELQKFLNANGFILSPRGVGSPGNETFLFGPMTYNALIKFQEKHKKEILTPAGLSRGTGILGPLTRAFLDKF